jgi:hypothetical protein
MFQRYSYKKSTEKLVMGGTFSNQVSENTDHSKMNKGSEVEKYFRPSNLPVLNDRFVSHFFMKYVGKKESEVDLPDYLMKSPKETVVNYFSLLREAANYEAGKLAGCGTIGNAKLPYPLAYRFLTSDYQKKLPYEQYLDTFQNILHISLIKYKEIPVYDNPLGIHRFFVEIETIGGSEKHTANFSYYYGFVDVLKEKDQYKISNLDFYGEDFLCAPYHGWSFDAEGSVQVRYGGWCKMIRKQYPTQQKDYMKYVCFQGTDERDYLILFFTLTNDTDIEIAQYIKDDAGKWKLIKLDPEKCLKNKQKE